MTPNSKIPTNVHNTQLLRSMARRRLSTISHEQGSHSEAVENRSKARPGKMSKEIPGRHSEPITHKDPGIPPPDDPSKPSINLTWTPGIVWRFKHARGRIRTLIKILFPKLTPDQEEVKQFIQEEKVKDKICKREGKSYRKRVSKILADLNNSEREIKWRSITRDPACSKIVLNMDINPSHLPPYVLVSRIKRDPLFTKDLAAALQREIYWTSGEYGVNLTIVRPVEAELPKRRRITYEELIADEE
jgi:hypothetical protein